MSEPEVLREESGDDGRYVIRIGAHEAELTFVRLADGVLRLDHTLVPEALGGQGLGKTLLAAAIADARRDGHRLRPVCSYAASQFDKHPDWADVRA